MAIDSTTFDELAELSMLSFCEKEKQNMINELNEMIAFLERIEQIEVKELDLELNNRTSKLFMREDTPSSTLDVNEIESNSPRFENGQFSVKR